MEENLSPGEIAKQGAKGAIFNTAAAAFSKLSGLLFYIVVLLAISPDDAGVYFLSLAVSGLIGIAGAFGMGESLARFIPYFAGSGQTGKVKKLTATVFLFFAFFFVLVALLGFAVKDAVTDYYGGLAPVLGITFAMGFFFSLNGILLSALLGLKKFGENALYSAAQPALKIMIVALLFYFYAPSLESALYATLLAAVLVDIFAAIRVIGHVRGCPGDIGFLGIGEVREIAYYGFAAALNQFSGYIMGWTDTLVLAYYATSPIVAAYNAMLSIARTVVHTVAGQIFLVLTSMLAHLHGAKSGIFGPLAGNAARWNLYLTLPPAILGVFFAKQGVEIFFPVYAQYYWLLYAFIPGFFVAIFSFPARSALSAVGRTDLLFKSTLVGIIPNVALNLMLVPAYGMPGAVLAIIVSTIISEFVAIFYAVRIAKFSFHPLLARGALPAIMMVVSLALSYKYLFDFAGLGFVFEIVGIGMSSLLALSVYFIIMVRVDGLNRMDYELMEKFFQAVKKAVSPRKLI